MIKQYNNIFYLILGLGFIGSFWTVPIARAETPTPTPSNAQVFSTIDIKSDVNIRSDNGIEWDRKNKIYRAVGNAKATYENNTVTADALSAHYRENDQGKTEIWLVEAEGNVVILADQGRAEGDRARFDVASQTLVMTGENLLVTGPDVQLTADDQVEYHGLKKMAVARGNAHVTQKDSEVKADVLVAYLKEKTDASKQPNQPSMDLDRVEAVGHVHIINPQGEVFGDKGIYYHEPQLAKLFGHIRLAQKNNFMLGHYAEVDFKNGINRIEAGSQQPVKGMVIPKDLQRPKDMPKSEDKVSQD